MKRDLPCKNWSTDCRDLVCIGDPCSNCSMYRPDYGEEENINLDDLSRYGD